MTIEFIEDSSIETTLKPVLISGSISTDYSNQQFLKLSNDGTSEGLYEIRYQAHCSPFKEALVIDNLLAVGHEENFYLFNLAINQNILRLEMAGYFGHIYYDTDLFYVADASGLHCIDKNGSIKWSNTELAIDGVIVTKFTDSNVLGSGESDPPGGWKNFSIDRITGIITT
jgi:hypothetical protein